MKIGQKYSIEQVYSQGKDSLNKTQGSVAFLNKQICSTLTEQKDLLSEKRLVKTLSDVDLAQDVPINLYTIISQIFRVNSVS